MSAYGKTDLAQAMVDQRKVVRSAIRLKHSIAADQELNRVMPGLDKYLSECAQRGEIPSLPLPELIRVAEQMEEAGVLSDRAET